MNKEIELDMSISFKKVYIVIFIFASVMLLVSSNLLAQDNFRWIAPRDGSGKADTTYNAPSIGLPYWDDLDNWERQINKSGAWVAATELPDATDDVFIQSGRNVCYIRNTIIQVPLANNITVEGDAAIFNKSSLGGVGDPLTITNDLVIQDDGYYFGEAESVVIGRDLIIEDGLTVDDGGAFIIINNVNGLRIGRNFVNEGMMAKRQVASTPVNVTFDTNVAGFIYADGSFNNDRNIFVQFDLSTRAGFDFEQIIADAVVNNVLTTGAFDRVIINKPQSTLHNNGDPMTAFTSPATAPFLVGVEGDGVNDFDGVGGVDPVDVVISSGSSAGDLDIIGGSLIIQNVTGLTNETVQVWDGSRGHPRGGENGNGTVGLDYYDNTQWVLPAADIDVRGNLQIANAQTGTPSYNGASLDLYNNGATAEEDYCLHLGGNLIDKNLFDPTEGATTQGLYIGPSNQINNASSFQSRPFIVFDGSNDQTIEGNIPNIRDYNNIANQGQGMVLPNVIVKKTNKTGGTAFIDDMYVVSIASGTNLRVFGDLTIYSGEFRVNNQRLLFADFHVDEINVMSIGAFASATPDNQGRLQVQNGASLLLASFNNSGTYRSTGSILRGRRGGEVILEGTASSPIEVSRESQPGGRIRMAMYSGAYFKARHGSYEWPSHVNTIGGSPGDVEYTTYQLGTTNNGAAGTDNNTGGTTSNGGLKIYDGVILFDYASNSWDPNSTTEVGKVHSLSNCYFTGSNQNNQSIFTFNTSGDYRIEGSLFNNYLDGSVNHKNIICNNASAFILVENSFGNMGGTLGDDNDAGGNEANITWNSGSQVLWQGDVSTSWSDYRNWQVPDQTGGLDDAGEPDNPDHLVPGIDITNVSVTIPRGATNHCIAQTASNILIEGSLLVNDRSFSGSNRRLTLDIEPNKMTVQGDVFVYFGGTLRLNPDEVLEIGGNFTANYADWGGRTANQTGNVSNIDAGTDSKVIFNGAGSQQLALRHNGLSIFEVDKPSGIATIQGISSWLTWNTRFDYLYIKAGHVRPLSDTPLDIKRGFQQTGSLGSSIFEPLKSSVTFRGEFKAQGGEMIAGSDVVRFYPLVPANTLTGAQDIWEIESTTNHVFNDVEFGDEGDGMVQRFFPDYLAAGFTWHPDDREVVTGLSETNTVETFYYLKSDLEAVGSVTVNNNRTLVNQGYTLKVGNADFESGSKFFLNSTNSATGQLQVASGGTVDFKSGSELFMVGEPTRFVKLSRADVNGRYTFLVNGTVTSRYYLAEYMDTDGIQLGASASSKSPGIVVYGGGGQNYENPSVAFTSIYEGTGAAATVNATGTALTGVVITNEGSGYTAVPNVTPATGAATFDVTLQGSPLNEIAVSSPGAGYSEADGLIAVAITDQNSTLGPPPAIPTATTATANAVVTNEVTSLTIGTNDNYTSPPNVSIDIPFINGEEYRAEAITNLNPSLLLPKTIDMLIDGVNYVDPEITLTSNDGNTFTFNNSSGFGTIINVVSGEIQDFTITGAMSTHASAGNFTFPITASVVDLSGPGGDAEVNTGEIEVVATMINDFTITNGGAGYDTGTPPTVTVDGAATATATVTAGDQIAGVVLTNVGANYVAVPTISISGGSTAATTDVSFDAGRVTDIAVNSGGSYLTIPDLTIDAPGGGGVTATAFAQGKGGTISAGSFTITDNGSNYRTAPIVTLTDTGNGFGARARARLAPQPIERFNILNGGSGYTAGTIRIEINSLNTGTPVATGGNAGGGAEDTNVGSGFVVADITIGDGVIRFVPNAQIIATGAGYSDGDVVTTSSTTGTGIDAEFIVISTNASNGATSLSVKDGGTGHAAGNVLTLTGGAQITLTAAMLADGVIKDISATNLTGANYTTSPEVVITDSGTGTGADIKALLAPSIVAGIELLPEEFYPVASFSDGIVTNTAYNGTAFTFDDSYNTYRDGANNSTAAEDKVGEIYPNTSGTFTAIDAGVTTAMHDYGAAFGENAGPRIDTIYNVVFAQNPIQASNPGGTDPFSSYNVRRVGSDNNPRNRIVFRDAIGTFSGEQFDDEDAITPVAANTESSFFNPNPIASDFPSGSGTTPGSLDAGMIDWVDLNLKRWDGGPDNTGTLWSEPANWRPDGVPSDFNDVIIDYSLLYVDYETNTTLPSADPSYGLPILQAPNPLNITMDYNYNLTSSASAKNLIFDSNIPSRVVGGTSLNGAINITIEEDFRIGGTISMDQQTTMTVGQDNLDIEVGESWSNAGIFDNGGATRNNTVRFYKDVTRTVVNTLDGKDGNDNLTGDRNAFYNVSFVQGVTELGSDILVEGDLAIEDQSATLDGSNRFLYLEGDWTNRGIFTNSNSTVYFRGSTPQVVAKEDQTMTLTGASLKEEFFNITINTQGVSNVAGAQNHVYLNSRLELNSGGQLRMLNGRIVADTDKELILGETSTVTLPATPSESYVQGPVGRLTDNTNTGTLQSLTYPVGSEKFGSTATFDITATSGVITGVTIATGGEGSGYEVDNLIEIPGGTGGKLRVTTVDANGGITAVTLESGGSSYTTTSGVVGEFSKGSGRAVYVGADEKAVVLDVALDNPLVTMFVVEQVEEAATTEPATGHPGRAVPSSTSFNYLSQTRHWTVQNLPYVNTGNISAANNSQLNIGAVGLSYRSNEEFIGGSIVNSASATVTVDELASAIGDEMKNATIWKDGGGDVTYGVSGSFTPSYASGEHADRVENGTAHSSNQWSEIGTSTTLGSAVSQAFITTPVAGRFNTLNDGKFALAFEIDPLPLEVLNLSAILSGTDVFVDWITVNESSTNFFVVERSADGLNFTDLGQIDGQGVSSDVNNYRYVDASPLDGINYYRLRQVNQDGTVDYSTIVSVNVDNGETFTIFPNPIEKGGLLKALIPSVQDEKANIELIDVTGKVILSREINLQESLVEMNLPYDLNHGVYIIRVRTETNIYQAKLLIQ